jgi:nucleoside-triphosphatase THEP1
MLKIVTGSIASGKTSKLLELYDRDPTGDGFVAIKKMRGEKVSGYDAMRLKTKEQFSLVVRDEFLQEPMAIEAQIGPYLFDRSAMEKIYETFDELIRNRVQPLYFDEVGLLEIEGKGFDSLIKKLVASGLDLILVVRQELVPAFLKRYQVKEYLIIS